MHPTVEATAASAGFGGSSGCVSRAASTHVPKPPQPPPPPRPKSPSVVPSPRPPSCFAVLCSAPLCVGRRFVPKQSQSHPARDAHDTFFIKDPASALVCDLRTRDVPLLCPPCTCIVGVGKVVEEASLGVSCFASDAKLGMCVARLPTTYRQLCRSRVVPEAIPVMVAILPSPPVKHVHVMIKR